MHDFFRSPVKITSLILVSVGVILLVLNIFLDWTINIALPLVFLVLCGGFFILEFQLRKQWAWAAYLYIPGGLLGAFGIIFLLDVLTQDWNSWAYAWLFLIVGAGIGLLLANIEYIHKPAVHISGWSMVLGGITFFAIFGAITGGLFIQIFAPILLVTAGVAIRWLHLERVLPIFQKPGSIDTLRTGNPSAVIEPLIEPLSSREVEVLRLIDGGLSNQQIADRLCVAPSTVKTHINNIYGKMNVQTRVQAVNRGRELGLFNS
ncbi:MAG TPA: LuxR C-terminal-related transcriptional regulator [Longilinea sp.]|nr:LuxR C-terminal-related transcriptional regulator [Longilinea sp.]